MPIRTTATAETIAGMGGDLDLEVLVTDEGLALLPSEVELLAAVRAERPITPELPALRATATALERLGRLTARQLERLSQAIEGHRDPHDVADTVWRILCTEVDRVESDALEPALVEPLTNAFVKLDAYAHANDERVGQGNEELDRTKVALTEAHGRRARLERLTTAVLEGARKAGGMSAFEGRYEELGNALKNLEAQAAKP